MIDAVDLNVEKDIEKFRKMFFLIKNCLNVCSEINMMSCQEATAKARCPGIKKNTIELLIFTRIRTNHIIVV